MWVGNTRHAYSRSKTYDFSQVIMHARNQAGFAIIQYKTVFDIAEGILASPVNFACRAAVGTVEQCCLISSTNRPL
jgi:hypothetical protein